MMMLKDERVEYLLRRAFPGSNAPPPPGSGNEGHKSWQRRHDARNAHRSALIHMPESELHALFEQALSEDQAQDRIRREKQTPPAQEPDADFWTREDEWSLIDGALLLTNLEPRSGLGLHLKKVLKTRATEKDPDVVRRLSDDAQRCLTKAQQIIRRAEVAGRNCSLESATDNETVYPRDLLIWARDKGYSPPPALGPLIADVRSRESLEDELKRLRAELDQVWKFDDSGLHYPLELDVATLAWQAVRNEKPASPGTVRQRLENWIRKNHSHLKLTKEAIERIATVASWDKQRGRKPIRNQ